jgi:hypothetical protein
VALPDPAPGLVIGYAYLWRNEALKRQEEGRKDRPCVIVLSVHKVEGRTLVTVAPITHTPPERPELAVEIPSETKQRLGLDDERAWIIADDLNRFLWPGVDLRPIRRGASTYAYGLLPGSLYRQVRDRVFTLARSGRAAITARSE